MPPISQRLNSLRVHPPSSVPLFCQSRPTPRLRTRFEATARNVSISSTSIKATLPAATKDEKSVVIDGLAELARVGLAGESRVRLAMRGLEGQDAGIRVAVLGRSGSEGRLVAALLADPLWTKKPGEKENEKEKGEQQWIKDLLSWSSCLREGEKRKGALLIRYSHGPPAPITTPPGSPFSLLSVPSPLLQRFALEILLAPLPSSPKDLAVVTLQATEIPGARIIEYPVHKTLFWAGEGPAGLSTLLGQPCTSTGPVLKAISLPGLGAAAAPENIDVKIIDLAIVEAAVTQRKLSTENTASSQGEWPQGGLEAIRQWLVAGSSNSATSGVKPAVKYLVSSIITEAESLLRQEQADGAAAKNAPEGRPALPSSSSSSSSSLAPDDMESLSRALEEWSQAAHSELRDGLTAAFTSKSWKSLAWWKLPWAADDVAHHSQDVVLSGLLPESKTKLLFLAGRFSGAGYRGAPSATAMLTSIEEELAEIRQPSRPVLDESYLGGADYYPPHIARTMDYILTDAVPRVQASANRLLIHAFSVSAISAVTSSLLYFSEVSIYSSASVAVFGLVYSARSLQRKWDSEKSWFKDAVAEGGRTAVVKTERWGWERLRMGRKVEEHVTAGGEGLKRVQEGRKAVGDVRRALESL